MNVSSMPRAPCRERQQRVSSTHGWDGYGADRGRAEAKRQVVAAVESVSAEVGNTPAVCRRCYIHPEVLDAHLDGTLGDVLGQKTARTGLT